MDSRGLWTKIALLVSRAVVSRTTARQCQELQVKLHEDEVEDDVEHFEPYGFTSRPRAGAEAITVSVGGDRSHLVAIVVGDRRYRITTLAEGEVAIHNDANASVVLRNTGDIVVTPGGTGRVRLGGSDAEDHLVTADRLSVFLRSIFNSWTPSPNDGGAALKAAWTAATVVPIGLQVRTPDTVAT